MATFNHNLGAGWMLQQTVDNKGNEIMTFRNASETITLENESVKKLREIFKSINK